MLIKNSIKRLLNLIKLLKPHQYNIYITCAMVKQNDYIVVLPNRVKWCSLVPIIIGACRDFCSALILYESNSLKAEVARDILMHFQSRPILVQTSQYPGESHESLRGSFCYIFLLGVMIMQTNLCSSYG